MLDLHVYSVLLQVSWRINVRHTLRTESVPVQFKTNVRVILTAIKPAIINVALMDADDSAERRLVCKKTNFCHLI